MLPPPAVNVDGCPAQIGDVPVSVMLGRGFNVTVTCVVAAHPAASVPVI